jgi:hypothetical protein
VLGTVASVFLWRSPSLGNLGWARCNAGLGRPGLLSRTPAAQLVGKCSCNGSKACRQCGDADTESVCEHGLKSMLLIVFKLALA